MTRAEAVATIRKSDLTAHVDQIVESLLPSVLIETTTVSMDDLPLGASRLGGVPDLPEHFDWPRWTGSRLEFAAFGVSRRTEFPERKLDFIAQFNLQELHHFPACDQLPPGGMLYFFYDTAKQPWGFDPEDHRGSRVVFVAAPGNLGRTGDPEGTLPCALSFTEDWTIADGEFFGFDYQHGLEEIESIGELKRDLLGTSEDNYFQPLHRLFGWPEPVQGGMQRECQLVANGIYCGSAYDDPRVTALIPGAKDWHLLLQIDSDTDNAGWMWGDCGRIYYWIHKDDLANRRFENSRLILQCS